MTFDWGDGTAPEVMEVDVARRSVAGSTRIRSGPSTTATTAIGVTPQLRIVNAGTVDITGLVVLFPEGTVDFGDVPAGGATAYRDVPGGVYRYAAYSYTLDGEACAAEGADWVGRAPCRGPRSPTGYSSLPRAGKARRSGCGGNGRQAVGSAGLRGEPGGRYWI